MLNSNSIDQSEIAKKRLTAAINGYLILRREDKVLLLLRKNTGYLDGHWCLPAGHIEQCEGATEGMVREAEEEIGVKMQPQDLRVVHIMHRTSNRINIDIFFECLKWKGEIENREPHKCESLSFFPLSSLPSQLLDYNRFVLNSVDKQFYSEWGFSLKDDCAN